MREKDTDLPCFQDHLSSVATVIIQWLSLPLSAVKLDVAGLQYNKNECQVALKQCSSYQSMQSRSVMSERDKQYFRSYGYVAAALAILAGIVLGFREAVEDILLTESGLIERASALGYFACAAYRLAKGGRDFIRTRG